MTRGVTILRDDEWMCHVCRRSRPDERISVAKHQHTDGNGITITHNVRYCNDNPMCRRAAHVRSHTELALQRVHRERDELAQQVLALQGKLVWSRGAFAIGAFLAGFIIRGGI